MGPVTLFGKSERGAARLTLPPLGCRRSDIRTPDRSATRGTAHVTRPGILHMVDSLDIGGTERMALNLVNCLAVERYAPYLCTTRRDGPLEDLVSPDVP